MSITRTSRLAVGAVLLALTATTLTIAAPPGQAWTARDRAEAPASRARIPSPADHLKGPGPSGGPSDRDPSDPPEGCDFDAGMGLAASRHATDRALVDDPWQLPGEFVVGTDGVIAYAHRYGWCEDYPDPRVHVAVIRGAAGRL